MKDRKIIKIKTERLRKSRNNLRKILFYAISKEYDRLREKKMELKQHSPSKHHEIYKINQKQIKLLDKRNSSILMCSSSSCKGLSEVDMVFDAETKNWYCESCYNKLLERRSPKRLFNQGIIVHENAQKPCHELKWCPYGPYIERFPITAKKTKYSCLVFGHNCPVFYISDKFNEDSSKKPLPNEKFVTEKRWLIFNTNEENLWEDIPKPCHELGWCPYGPIVQYSKERKKLTRSMCILFKKDCPAFYLSQNIMEDLSFQSK